MACFRILEKYPVEMQEEGAFFVETFLVSFAIV